MNRKIWLITGAGSGIGYSLTRYLLNRGYSVAALTRDEAALAGKLSEYGEEKLLCLRADLTSTDSLRMCVESVLCRFGSIDVVVNNAGYEKMGYIEELDEKEIREEFEINFYAPIRMMKLTLPVMREQGKGLFINLSSICGVCRSYAGSCAYNASKAALHSLSQCLSDEAADMGIYSTSLICGQFRTSFFDNVQLSGTELKVYDKKRKKKKDGIDAMNHRQRGDAEKLCRMMVELSEMTSPPKELYVGNDAYSLGYDKALDILANLRKWEAFSRRMDIDEGELADGNY